ncbi:hypothetical protein CCR94_16290 [Rhodoblastus sphagnicola]|uniref:Uncharacterized protein n=1 Tax=Rhodoblastus sphagnicola TaxID=333368 RepID=A0A2S6N2W7_9HYPH|nr:hypothetical protein [Rhodoblastus sphagnicola]MBB4199054.1 hypothetical protein [Rhodoblastus sphagnicola]PPQ28949.1 hypothetical protein CCR94_16290 [Rhodoblastus sphagnicola]
MPFFDRTPKTLPTQTYVVVADVENLHIAGRKVLKGNEITISAPVAAHWLSEGVIALKAAASAAAAPAKTAASATDKAAS